MRVLLVSVYELGHQPFSIASARTRLEAAGHEVCVADASIAPPGDGDFTGAEIVAISVPMHTALRLGVELAERARAANPWAHVAFFGLYAWLNAESLLTGSADSVVGGEVEGALALLTSALATSAAPDVPGVTTKETLAREHSVRRPVLERIRFTVPNRTGMPPLSKYARMLGPRAGESRLVAYVEASRGCKHRCLHCPVTPVYDGRFFIVPPDVVLADAEQQIALGAMHVTFGDPDFLNGPKHALRVATALYEAHPEVSFDITTKVEHVLAHRDIFPELARLGCAFVVSAVESLSERVLRALDKGHTRADVIEALAILRGAGIELRPSLVPFTPWSSLDDTIELIDFVIDDDLVDNVDPIQLAIRLLVPPGSALLASAPTLAGTLDASAFTYEWKHEDPRVDALFAEVSRAVEEGASRGDANSDIVRRVRELAYRAAGREAPAIAERPTRFVPRLTESWFCCAEPSAAQRAIVAREAV